MKDERTLQFQTVTRILPTSSEMKVTRRKKKVKLTSAPVVQSIRLTMSLWPILRTPIRRKKCTITHTGRTRKHISTVDECARQNVEMLRQFEKMVNCRFCHKKFEHKSILARHERTHTNEKPYACEMCGLKFAQVSNRNSHMKNVCQKIKLSCPICGDLFTGSSNLNHHLNGKHQMKERVRCDVCGITVQTDLKRHRKTAGHIRAVQLALCVEACEEIGTEEEEENVINETPSQSMMSLFEEVAHHYHMTEDDGGV